MSTLLLKRPGEPIPSLQIPLEHIEQLAFTKQKASNMSLMVLEYNSERAAGHRWVRRNGHLRGILLLNASSIAHRTKLVVKDQGAVAGVRIRAANWRFSRYYLVSMQRSDRPDSSRSGGNPRLHH
jgi:hypothetical protein